MGAIETTASPAAAKQLFAELIRREPVALSVVASNIDGLIADPTRYERPRWWAIRDAAGEVAAAFMHTPPHPLHIALASTNDAVRIADQLADQDYSLPGVGGMRSPAEAFAQAWRGRQGADTSVVMELGVFTLAGAPVLPFEVAGVLRWASEADQLLVDEWAHAFAVEAGTDSGVRHDWSPHVRAGRLALWEAGGIATSMAFHSVANGGVTRISGVYTPRDQRGYGYASAVVAGLSARCQALGLTCSLYTDLANPTSNKIYEALGYRRIGDSITITFQPPYE